MLRLGHLNLTVSDVNRAASFYATWFGFDQVLAGYPDNTRFVTDGSGFELALHEGFARKQPLIGTLASWPPTLAQFAT